MTEVQATAGKAFIKGLNTVSQRLEIRKELGYCPQSMALIELLTAREHIDLFCEIRGIERSQVKAQIDEL